VSNVTYSDPVGQSLLQDTERSRRVQEEFDHYVELSSRAFEAQRKRIESLEALLEEKREEEEDRGLLLPEKMEAVPPAALNNHYQRLGTSTSLGGNEDVLSLATDSLTAETCSKGHTLTFSVSTMTMQTKFQNVAVGTTDCNVSHTPQRPSMPIPPHQAQPPRASSPRKGGRSPLPFSREVAMVPTSCHKKDAATQRGDETRMTQTSVQRESEPRHVAMGCCLIM